MAIALTAILVAYLFGAVPFGLLIARLFGIPDVRRMGSGNIGATNVLRVLGLKAAIWVYLLDIGKGAAAVLLARSVEQSAIQLPLFAVLAGIAAILGHVFPVYLKFRGGKGVATAAGVLVMLLPVETLAAAVVFLAVALVSRYVSLASILAALALPAAVAVEQTLLHQDIPQIYWVLTVAIGIFVPITHHRNIRRLLTGTENRFGLSRGKGGGHG